MFETWTPAVLSLMNNVSAMRSIGVALGDEREDLALAHGEAERVGRLGRARLGRDERLLSRRGSLAQCRVQSREVDAEAAATP